MSTRQLNFKLNLNYNGETTQAANNCLALHLTLAQLPLPSFPPQVTALQNESAREASRVQRKRFRDLAQMMASRVHHSKAYVAFYLVMAVLNTTLVLWIILSKHGHPHSIAFLGLELLITVVLCAEVSIRLIAVGRVRHARTLAVATRLGRRTTPTLHAHTLTRPPPSTTRTRCPPTIHSPPAHTEILRQSAELVRPLCHVIFCRRALLLPCRDIASGGD